MSDGGAIIIALRSILLDKESIITFSHNSGTNGGALCLEDGGVALFNGNTSVTFVNNTATSGVLEIKAALYLKGIVE